MNLSRQEEIRGVEPMPKIRMHFDLVLPDPQFERLKSFSQKTGKEIPDIIRDVLNANRNFFVMNVTDIVDKYLKNWEGLYKKKRDERN